MKFRRILLACVTAMLAVAPVGWALTRGETVLFKDSFSKPTKLWGAGSDKYGTVKYVNGTLHIAPAPGGLLRTYYNRKIANIHSMHVAADAWLVSGIAHNNMDVSCAAIGGAYEFVIGSNGLIAMGKTTKTGEVALQLTHNKSAIRRGKNHVDGYCTSLGTTATTLTMKVNGRQLMQVNDFKQPFTSFVSVGLAAASREPGKNVEVAFDNVLVGH